MHKFISIWSTQFIIKEVRDLSWKPPPEGKFKLNSDGAPFRSSSTAGIGVILQYTEGDVIMVMSKGSGCLKWMIMKHWLSSGVTIDISFGYL